MTILYLSAGDALATHVMDEAATALGVAIAWCVNLFNPRHIILGGGLL
ncbi:MAG: ROK family protein [Chloroflexota bacterium]|nr:ROK family protein [Chloroflexota bacterium]MDE2948026.1 ROK family protein [Chloroflexota bacterium]